MLAKNLRGLHAAARQERVAGAGVAGNRRAKSRGGGGTLRVVTTRPTGTLPLITKARNGFYSQDSSVRLNKSCATAAHLSCRRRCPVGHCFVVDRGATESRAHPPLSFILFPFSEDPATFFFSVKDL